MSLHDHNKWTLLMIIKCLIVLHCLFLLNRMAVLSTKSTTCSSVQHRTKWAPVWTEHMACCHNNSPLLTRYGRWTDLLAIDHGNRWKPGTSWHQTGILFRSSTQFRQPWLIHCLKAPVTVFVIIFRIILKKNFMLSLVTVWLGSEKEAS